MKKNMKHISMCIAAVGVIALASCGGSSETKTADAAATAAPAGPVIAIDASGWAATDLSTLSTMIPVSMNLPKDAKMEKNGNGGVDIRLNEAYTITVSNIAVGSVKEAMDSDKTLNVNNKTSYKDGKVITEEANGYVYQMQMNDEANGTKYEPEAHFFFYLEKDGAVYSISDNRPMDNGFLPGSTYAVDNATKLYESVKATAKLK